MNKGRSDFFARFQPNMPRNNCCLCSISMFVTQAVIKTPVMLVQRKVMVRNLHGSSFIQFREVFELRTFGLDPCAPHVEVTVEGNCRMALGTNVHREEHLKSSHAFWLFSEGKSWGCSNLMVLQFCCNTLLCFKQLNSLHYHYGKTEMCSKSTIIKTEK